MLAEYVTPGEGEISKARLEAIQSIKELLSQIDHMIEKLPFEDSERIIGLLTSLKGAPLNIEEKKIVLEISG